MRVLSRVMMVNPSLVLLHPFTASVHEFTLATSLLVGSPPAYTGCVTKPVTVTLLSKPECHLCDEARAIVERVLSEVAQNGLDATFEEINILADEQLARRFAEDIPVVRINGKQHSFWHVDPERFARAVEKASRRGFLRG